jgi:hypothetical protein
MYDDGVEEVAEIFQSQPQHRVWVCAVSGHSAPSIILLSVGAVVFRSWQARRRLASKQDQEPRRQQHRTSFRVFLLCRFNIENHLIPSQLVPRFRNIFLEYLCCRSSAIASLLLSNRSVPNGLVFHCRRRVPTLVVPLPTKILSSQKKWRKNYYEK